MGIVINMLSGPGSGKSTLAAELFVKMKKLGYKVEYLQEYPKQLVWQKKFERLNNQYYVSQKYYESIAAMIDHVDYIILDSSLINGVWYNRNNKNNVSNIEKTEEMILKRYNLCKNINFFIHRGNYIYETGGRIESEEVAKVIDKEIIDILKNKQIRYHDVFIDDDNVVQNMIEIIVDSCKVHNNN